MFIRAVLYQFAFFLRPYFQSGGINDQMDDFIPRRRLDLDVDAFDPLIGAEVVWQQSGTPMS